jgi:hypothetical protein
MDIDIITDLTHGFEITLGTNPLGVIGNRALLNRFEVTLLTKRRQFILGDKAVVDNYGGDAQKFVDRPQVLNNIQSISASLSTAVEQTVQSMINDQPLTIPDTEKIISAEILSIDIINDVISATIQVHPVQVESYDDLIFNLPIIKE